MFDARLVHAVLDAVPDAVVDGGWGVDALVGRQTRAHDDLDLIVASTTADAAVAALGPLGLRRGDGRASDPGCGLARGRHVMSTSISSSGRSTGTTQQLPGDGRFTYFLDGTTGMIDGRSVRCLSPQMQLLTHAGYEPDDDDRADVALVADAVGSRVAPAVCIAAAGRRGGARARRQPSPMCPRRACVRMRSWRAAYAGLMPQPVIDSIDLGTMWSAWHASVRRPPSRSTRLFVAGPPGEVHSYAWVRPVDGSRGAGEVGAMYSDPTAWGSTAGWAAFSTAVDFLRSRGRTDLSLWMLKGNERAGRFYERAGWRPDGEEHTTTTAAGSYVEVRYRLVES